MQNPTHDFKKEVIRMNKKVAEELVAIAATSAWCEGMLNRMSGDDTDDEILREIMVKSFLNHKKDFHSDFREQLQFAVVSYSILTGPQKEFVKLIDLIHQAAESKAKLIILKQSRLEAIGGQLLEEGIHIIEE